MTVRLVLLPLLLSAPVTSGGRVILLVTEGLTESLLSRVPTPAIDALMSQGTVASLKPEFPSETLPTMAAMMTGQHSETTGVLDRVVKDQAGNILHSDTSPEFWQYDQNLTNIMELNSGVAGHKTGCILWPGEKFLSVGCDQMWTYDIVMDVTSLDNETNNRNKRLASEDYYSEEADYVEVEEMLNKDKSDQTNTETGEFFLNKTSDQEWLMWENQISTMMKWFTVDKDPVNFVLFNVYQPGNYIRTFGPNSEEAGLAMQKVDQMIASLVEQLEKNKLYEEVNIVLTGGHGFAEITADKVFDISQYLPDKNSQVLVGHSPVLNIFHSENQDLNIYASLSKGPRDEKYDLYIHKDIPAEYHYKDNERVGTMTLVAKEGFAFFDVWDDFKELNSAHHRKDLLENRYGIAGYDNSLESMQSVVILHGPNIQPLQGPEHSKPKINAVDVFPLLSHLLEIPTVKTNGSMSAVRNIFKYPPSQSIEAIKKVIKYYTEEDKLPKTVSILVISTLTLILVICCGACAIRKRNRNLGKHHNYKYSSVKHNRRTEGRGREDGSVEDTNDDKVGLLTSALMEEELEENMPV